jgi:hypothetical protein
MNRRAKTWYGAVSFAGEYFSDDRVDLEIPITDEDFILLLSETPSMTAAGCCHEIAAETPHEVGLQGRALRAKEGIIRRHRLKRHRHNQTHGIRTQFASLGYTNSNFHYPHLLPCSLRPISTPALRLYEGSLIRLREAYPMDIIRQSDGRAKHGRSSAAEPEVPIESQFLHVVQPILCSGIARHASMPLSASTTSGTHIHLTALARQGNCEK